MSDSGNNPDKSPEGPQRPGGSSSVESGQSVEPSKGSGPQRPGRDQSKGQRSDTSGFSSGSSSNNGTSEVTRHISVETETTTPASGSSGGSGGSSSSGGKGSGPKRPPRSGSSTTSREHSEESEESSTASDRETETGDSQTGGSQEEESKQPEPDSDNKPDSEDKDADGDEPSDGEDADGERTEANDGTNEGGPEGDKVGDGEVADGEPGAPGKPDRLGTADDAAGAAGEGAGKAAAGAAGEGAAEVAGAAGEGAAGAAGSAGGAAGASGGAAGVAGKAGGVAGSAGRAVKAGKALKDGKVLDAADEGTKVAVEQGGNFLLPGSGTVAVETLERVPGGKKVTRVATMTLLASAAMPIIIFFVIVGMIVTVITSVVGTVSATTAATACTTSTSTGYEPGAQGNMQNAEYIWKSLRGAGFSPQATAGILGNLDVETGTTFDPKIVQQGGGPGRGIAQWSAGGRWDTSDPNMLGYAKSKSQDPLTLQAQVGFLMLEMQNGYNNFNIEEYKKQSNEVDATIYFHTVYEQSNDTGDYVRTERGGRATNWLNQFKNVNSSLPGNAPSADPVNYRPGVGGGSSDWYMPVALPQGHEPWTIATGLGNYSGHTGMDFNVVDNTPIYAIAKGTVTNYQEFPGEGQSDGFVSYGRLIEIKHVDGTVSKYAHLTSSSVKAGDTVQAGQQIGLSGHYGHVIPTGPAGAHLHFEILVNDAIVEPLTFLQQHQAKEPTGGTAGGSTSNKGACGGSSGRGPGQTEVSPSTCPKTAPEGSLRGGAETIGVQKLCEDSVRQARTPEGAKAILYAFSKLGTPYSQELRTTEGFFDCSSLVARAYAAAGVQTFFGAFPATCGYTPEAYQGVLEQTTTPQSGDVRIMWEGGGGPENSCGDAGHAQMYIAEGFIIQSGGGRPSDVNVNLASETWGWTFASFKHLGKK